MTSLTVLRKSCIRAATSSAGTARGILRRGALRRGALRCGHCMPCPGPGRGQHAAPRCATHGSSGHPTCDWATAQRAEPAGRPWPGARRARGGSVRTARGPQGERIGSAGPVWETLGGEDTARPRGGGRCAVRGDQGRGPGTRTAVAEVGSEVDREARAALPLLAAEHRARLVARCSEGTRPAGAREGARKKSAGPAGLLGTSRGSGTTVARGTQQDRVGSCHQRGRQTAVPQGSGNQLKGWGTHAPQQ